MLEPYKPPNQMHVCSRTTPKEKQRKQHTRKNISKPITYLQPHCLLESYMTYAPLIYPKKSPDPNGIPYNILKTIPNNFHAMMYLFPYNVTYKNKFPQVVNIASQYYSTPKKPTTVTNCKLVSTRMHYLQIVYKHTNHPLNYIR